MKKRTRHDYGKCHICGERMKEKLIKQDFWLKGELIVVEDVPAGVCPQCGEKVVKAEVGRQLAGLLTDAARRPTARTINVPVIPYIKEVA